MRVGIGYDVHAFIPGRPLMLGGIHIPHPFGLAGHSDADVLIHAICDAILGAMAEGDIGVHFPDTNDNHRGMASETILAFVCDLAKNRGYTVVNVDAVVVAEEPKIAPHREAIRENIARIAGIDKHTVSIKGKTTEGLGFAGRREGIEVHAIALVEKTVR